MVREEELICALHSRALHLVVYLPSASPSPKHSTAQLQSAQADEKRERDPVTPSS